MLRSDTRWQKDGHAIRSFISSDKVKSLSTGLLNRVFHKLDEVGNNANIGITIYYVKTKKISKKCYP